MAFEFDHVPMADAPPRLTLIAANASEWTARGPLSARSAEFPEWYLGLHVWVNTGWQCLDRFNATQGDPATVLANVRAISRRFALGQPLGLHWYEWQCGYADGCPSTQARRFTFDTQYPDYLPPRDLGGFADVIDALAAEGVATFPYVNGRIFDNSSASWVRDGGESHVVAQSMAPRLAPGGTGGVVPPLAPCMESYGSLETDGSRAWFGVADPTSAYWQSKYASLVGKLVGEHHASGVYIDQLCAASPLADWSAGRAHRGGGGAWWRRGLTELLDDAMDEGAKAAARRPLLVTESNSEFLLDRLHGLLTLAAFELPFAHPTPRASEPGEPGDGEVVLAPAFAAVYGGYYVAFGSIFTRNDLVLDHGDVYASRLATSFVYGAALGWFSLGGVEHGPDVDTKCGQMGTLDAFLSADAEPQVAFLRSLATARHSARRYLVHGRLGTPLAITPPPRTFVAPAQQVPPKNAGPFPTLSSAVWFDEHDARVCIFLVAVTAESVHATFMLDMAATYPIQPPESAHCDDDCTPHDNYDVFLLGSNGHPDTLVQRVRGSARITLNRTVLGRTVEMLEVRPVAPIKRRA